MSNVRVPSLRHHKPSGQGVVTLSGKDFYLGPWPAHMRKPPPEVKANYDAKITEWLAAGRRLPEEPKEPITLSQVIEEFWQHVETHYCDTDGKPTGEGENFRFALRPLRHLYGSLPASEFSPLKLKAVRQLMIDGYDHPKYGRQESLSRRVINSRIRRIVRMVKWAVSEEKLPIEVYQGLTTVRGLERGRTEARETAPVTPVALEVVETTLPYLNRHLAAMIRLLSLTGMRPAEVCIMRACDLDTSGNVWLYRPSRHKTLYRGKERVIALGPKAQATVRPFLRLDTQAYLFSPAEAEAERIAARTAARKTPPSCGNRPGTNRKKQRRKKPGEKYTTASLRHAVDMACTKVNRRLIEEARERGEKVKDDAVLFPSWFPYQLRHSHATDVRRQFGLEGAQVALGHSSADVTQVYAERDLTLATRIAAEIG